MIPRPMQEHVRLFIWGVSLVVYGSATAIRGLLVGNAVQIVVGLFLLVVVLVTELAEIRLRRGISRRTEHRLRSLVATYEPWRRVGAVAFALFVCDSVIRCIVSAVNAHWGDCVFYVVTGVAAAGGLIGATASPAELPEDDRPELGGLTTS